jgi:hypothetical protein
MDRSIWVTLLSDVDGTSASTSPLPPAGEGTVRGASPGAKQGLHRRARALRSARPVRRLSDSATPAWRAAPAASHRLPALRHRARSWGILRRERPCASLPAFGRPVHNARRPERGQHLCFRQQVPGRVAPKRVDDSHQPIVRELGKFEIGDYGPTRLAEDKREGFDGAASGLVARMRSQHFAPRSDRPKPPRPSQLRCRRIDARSASVGSPRDDRVARSRPARRRRLVESMAVILPNPLLSESPAELTRPCRGRKKTGKTCPLWPRERDGS